MRVYECVFACLFVCLCVRTFSAKQDRYAYFAARASPGQGEGAYQVGSFWIPTTFLPQGYTYIIIQYVHARIDSSSRTNCRRKPERNIALYALYTSDDN